MSASLDVVPAVMGNTSGGWGWRGLGEGSWLGHYCQLRDDEEWEKQVKSRNLWKIKEDAQTPELALSWGRELKDLKSWLGLALTVRLNGSSFETLGLPHQEFSQLLETYEQFVGSNYLPVPVSTVLSWPTHRRENFPASKTLDLVLWLA